MTGFSCVRESTWHLPAIPGFLGNWRRHQFPDPSAVEFRRIALAEGLAPPGLNGGYNARECSVVPKSEWMCTGRLTSN